MPKILSPTDRILVTGAGGRYGSALVKELRRRYGEARIVATDLTGGPGIRQLDVLDRVSLLAIVKDERIVQIYHLAGLLSQAAEKHRELARRVNTDGLLNVLDAAKIYLLKVFWPSSVAAVAPAATVYGLIKVTGEYWCRYFRETYGVDVRVLRLPPIYVPGAPSRGGLTDLIDGAITAALQHKPYKSYLKEQTSLEVLHLSDAVSAVIWFMQADLPKGPGLCGTGGITLSPALLADFIRPRYPDFSILVHTDERQQLASLWQSNLIDLPLLTFSGWQQQYHLDRLLQERINSISSP